MAVGDVGTTGTARLKDGTDFPLQALGTWKLSEDDTEATVKAAVRAGYRLIDCANDYGNEHMVGSALKELIDGGEIRREDMFLQAKLWNGNHHPANVPLDLEATLRDLQTDYLDSFLIHWPQACPSLPTQVPGVAATRATLGSGHHSERPADFSGAPGAWMFPTEEDGRFSADLNSHYVETWGAMEQLVDQGRVRSLGVCNFNKTQLKELLDSARLPVCINQCERHPYLQQKDLMDFCMHNGILFQAFSPLASFDRPDFCRTPHDPPPIFESAALREVAAKHQRSVAQVTLRWHLQTGGAYVAKSSAPERLRENIDVLTWSLDRADLDLISSLNIGWRHLLGDVTAHHPDFPFRDELPYGFAVGGAIDPNDNTVAKELEQKELLASV